MPNPHQLDEDVAIKAWHLVTTFPLLRITSGRRTKRQNDAAGGSPTSLHLRGRAVDLVGPVNYMMAVMHYARTLNPDENLLHDKGSGLHLHLAWR